MFNLTLKRNSNTPINIKNKINILHCILSINKLIKKINVSENTYRFVFWYIFFYIAVYISVWGSAKIQHTTLFFDINTLKFMWVILTATKNVTFNQGNTYHACTKDGNPDRRCWCYTGRREGYEGTFDPTDDQWGYCPCATTTLYGYWNPWLPWQRCDCGLTQLRGRYCRFPLEAVSFDFCKVLVFLYKRFVNLF